MTAPEKKTVRIAIDGGDFFPTCHVKSGITRILASYVKGLPGKSALQYRYYYFGASGGKAGVNTKVLPARLFSAVFLPLAMLRDRIRVFLGFSGVLPGLVRTLGMKSLVFVYDLGFYKHPELYGDPSRMKWQTEYALYGADRIIVCSDYIKKQIRERFPSVPEKKIIRIYPGADHLPAPSGKPPVDGAYFLYVGVIKPGKNIELLLSRFFDYVSLHPGDRVRLVLAGAKQSAYFEKIKGTALFRKLEDRLVFLEDIEDRDLAALYRGSLAVLNLSHEEGFCFPAAEALALGKTVIVNDIPLYREFAPYFPGLVIEGEGKRYVQAMEKAALDKKPAAVKAHPFTWAGFRREVERAAKEVVL